MEFKAPDKQNCISLAAHHNLNQLRKQQIFKMLLWGTSMSSVISKNTDNVLMWADTGAALCDLDLI